MRNCDMLLEMSKHEHNPEISQETIDLGFLWACYAEVTPGFHGGIASAVATTVPPEAAEKTVGKTARFVRFAGRGAGRPGHDFARYNVLTAACWLPEAAHRRAGRWLTRPDALLGRAASSGQPAP